MMKTVEPLPIEHPAKRIKLDLDSSVTTLENTAPAVSLNCRVLINSYSRVDSTCRTWDCTSGIVEKEKNKAVKNLPHSVEIKSVASPSEKKKAMKNSQHSVEIKSVASPSEKKKAVKNSRHSVKIKFVASPSEKNRAVKNSRHSVEIKSVASSSEKNKTMKKSRHSVEIKSIASSSEENKAMKNSPHSVEIKSVASSSTAKSSEPESLSSIAISLLIAKYTGSSADDLLAVIKTDYIADGPCLLCNKSEEEQQDMVNLCDKCSAIYTAYQLRKAIPLNAVPKNINVIAINEGINIGYHALKKLSVSLQAYYALEHNDLSMNISNHHFGKFITYMKIKKNKNIYSTPIDVNTHLIFGKLVHRPSYADLDSKSLRAYFTEFLYTLREYYGKSNKLYWLFEAIGFIPLPTIRFVSRYLKCFPYSIKIGKHQQRLLWGNLPTLKSPLCTKISSTYNEFTSELPWPKQITVKDIHSVEKMLGLPVNFTAGFSLTNKQRLDVLHVTSSVKLYEKLFDFLPKS